MPTYRWTGERPLRRNDTDEVVEQGETFEVDSDREDDADPVERAFSDLVEPADADEDDTEEDDADEGPPDEVANLLDGTVADVEEALESGDYDEYLDDIEEYAERAGVQDAVEDRR